MKKFINIFLVLCLIFLVKKSDGQCNFYQLSNTGTTTKVYTYYACGATTTSTISLGAGASYFFCAKQIVTTGYTQVLVSSFTYSQTCITTGNSVTLTAASTPNVASSYFNISGPPGGVNSKTWNINSFSAASSGLYSVTLGGCSSTTTSLSVGIFTNLTVSSNSPVCEGNTLSLSSIVTGDAGLITYNWTGPNGFTSNVANPTVSTNATTAMSGTYTLTATLGLCVKTATVNVQINKSTASSNGPVCQGATLNLSASTIAGATYYWTGPNGFTSTEQNPTVSTNATDVMAGTYSVYTTANGCTSPVPGTVDVVVKPLPSNPVAGSNSPVCVGAPLTLSASTISGVTYSWTGPNSYTSTQQNPTVSASATTLMGGVYSVVAILNGCSSPSPSTVNVEINKITATNNGPVCPGKTLSLSATSVTGATYSWTGPNGFTSTEQNPVVSINATTAMSGPYSVTSTANGCTSAVSSTIATVNPTPAAPTVTTPISYCQNITATALTATGTSLLWYTTDTSTTGVITAPVPSTAVPGTKPYYVTQTVNTCVSPKAVINVVVNPLTGAAGPISGFNRVCTSQTGVTYTVDPIPNATNYIWTIPTGTTGSSTTNSIVVTFTPSAVSGNNITVKGNNACGNGTTSSLLINIGTLPAASITATNSTTICAGASVELRANTGTGLIYQWKKDGVVIDGATSYNYFATQAGSYTAVVGYNASCTQTSNAIGVTVNPTPTVAVNSSSQSICSGMQVSLTASGAATYSWYPSTGLSASSGSIVNASPTATTTYNVIGSNATGCKDTASITITVAGGPMVTPTFTQVQDICTAGTFTLPTTSNNGVAGSWTPAINGSATTTYTFTPDAGQCANIATMTVSVNAPVTPTFTQIASICAGASFTWPATSNNGITGSWSPAINNTSTTTYTFTPDAGQCANSTSMTVTVNQPVTPVFTQVDPICQGQPLSLPTTSVNGIVGVWSPAINSSATTTYTFTPYVGQCATVATMTVTVLTSNGNQTITQSACDSYIWATNVQTYTSSGSYTFVNGCATQILNLTITTSTSNSTSATACESYTWAVNNQTYTSSGSYSSVNGCSTQILNLTITSPSAPAVTSPVTYTVGANAVALTATGTSLKWYTASSGGVGSATAPTPSTATPGTFVYYVSQTISTCESPRAAITVYILQPTTSQYIGINITNPQRNLHIKDVMRLEPRSTAPANPAEGDIYYDSTLKKLRVFDGNNWKDCW